MTTTMHSLKTVGVSFFAGCVVGGIAGVLYAPQSGARTRRRLGNFAADIRDKAEDVTADATMAIERVVEEGRRLVNV